MNILPHICGKNRLTLPMSGCDDCEIYSIEDELLDSLTPIECYEPPCEQPIVCQTTVCCAKVGCTQEEVEPTEVSQ